MANPNQFYYRYEGRTIRMPRPLMVNSDITVQTARESLQKAPEQVQTLVLQNAQEYLLFENEFPGLMSKGRDRGWGYLRKVRPYEPPKPKASSSSSRRSRSSSNTDSTQASTAEASN